MLRNAVQVRLRRRCLVSPLLLFLHIGCDGIGPLSGETGSTESTSVPQTRAEADCVLNTNHKPKYWRDKLKIQPVLSLKVRGKALGS